MSVYRRSLGVMTAALILLSFVLLPSTAQANGVDLKINFSDASTTPPSGYLRDSGAAYGDRGGGNTYGWVVPGTSTPLDLTGNGRNRTGFGIDLRQATLMHMQADDISGSFTGVKQEGWWEVAVPNGIYSVTVSVGDANGTDSVHRIHVEGALAINDFVPAGSGGAPTMFRTATALVQVLDGRLTVGASFGNTSGTNTKINYVDIVSATGPARPTVIETVPANRATNIPVSASISVTGIYLPNGGLEQATVNNDSVYLHPTSGNPVTDRVPLASLNTTGGGDAITLTPAQPLLSNTNYTLVITDAVRDGADAQMVPFSMTFTTGSGGGSTPTVISFSRSVMSIPARGYTSATVGPDGRFYASTTNGQVYAWNIDPLTGQISGSGRLIVDRGLRVIVGLEFQPGQPANSPVLWITDNFGQLTGAPHFTGKIVRLNGTNPGQPDEAWTATEMVTGLPRARKDHLANSLEFGPDGALYMMMGSISATGDRDNSWGLQPETLLSAAVIRIDVNLLNAYRTLNGQPLNVRTGADVGTGDLANPNTAGNPGLGDPLLDFTWPDPTVPAPAYNLYNPQAANAPLTIYATGIRNAYDLVWHTNGNLYTATNGSAAGGSVPPTPGGVVVGNPATWPVSCRNRIDDGTFGDYSGPTTTGSVSNLVNQTDLLFRILPGGYYGHPNPTRCEWVKDGGNPTAGLDYGQIGNHYPVGTQPDRNYRGFALDLGFNKSPNGTIEYRNATAFGGALTGRLMIVRYSQNDDIVILTPNAFGGIVGEITGVRNTSGFSNPLDLTENVATGDVYVVEYGSEGTSSDNKIYLLRPDTFYAGTPAVQSSTSRLVYNDVIGGSPSAERTVTISNVGTGTLGISLTPTITGASAAMFQLGTTPTVTVLNPPAAGGTTSATFGFSFNPPSGTTPGPKFATVTIATTAGPVTIELAGLATNGIYGGNEPSLQYIMDAYGFTINVGDDNPATSSLHSTLANNAPLLGQEIAAEVFTRAEAGNVAVYPLAVFGPNSGGFGSTLTFGWYGMANTASKNPVLTVTNTSDQTVNPAYQSGSSPFSFDPGAAPFGFYTIWPAFSNREIFSEDRLNTWADPMRHKMRVYPFILPSGVVPNAYVVAIEETPTGQDYNDFVFLVMNVQPAPVVPGGTVMVENRDWAGLNALPTPITQLNYLNTVAVFSRINSGVGSHRSHNTVTLRIKNTDPVNPLRVTNLALSDTARFELVRRETSFNLSANGGFYDLDVRFIENSGSAGIRNATLTLTTSDPTNPAVVIYLNGNYMVQPETDEPSITQLLGAYGFTSDIDLPLSAQYVARGDEVLSFRWKRADNTQPVHVRQIAAYHGCCSTGSTFQIDGAGGGSFTHDPVDGQSVLPLRSGVTTGAEMTITPTSNSFVISVDGSASNTCESALNGSGMCSNHGLRFWALRDYAGNIVPNTYLIIQDVVTSCGALGTCDWNDNVYIATNLAPASTAPATVTLNAPANGAVVTNGYGDPTFTWTNVAEATYYYFYIATSAGVQVVNEVLSRDAYCTGGTCSFVPSGLRESYRLFNGDYFWTVTSWGPFGVGATAPLNYFTVTAGLPDLVTLDAATGLNTLRPTLKWSLNTVNQRRAVGFNVYLAPTADLGMGAFFQYVSRIDACGSPTGNTCTFVSPVDLIDGTAYSLYVQSYGPGGFTLGGPFDNGYQGPDAGVASFTVDAPTPDLPTPVSVNFSSGLPLISWPDDADATSFNVYIGNPPDWSFVFFQNYPRTTGAGNLCNAGTCSVTPLVGLAHGQVLNFAVQGVGPGGTSLGGTYDNGYGVVENQTVNVAVPATPNGGLSPAASSTITQNTPAFKWNTVSGASAYQLLVLSAASGTLHQQWYWSAAPECTPSQCSITPALDLAPGAHIWSVQAYGPGGFSDWAGGTGVGIAFTVSDSLPGVVTINGPNGSTTNPSPTFTWNDIAIADSYEVWIGTTAFVISHNQVYPATRGSGQLCNSGICSLVVPGLILPNGDYYFNVRAISSGGIGEWNFTTYAAFTVAVPVPGAVNVSTMLPIHDGIVANTNRPTLQWDTVTNGRYYYVEVLNGMDMVVFGQWYERGVAPCTNSQCQVQLPNVIPYGGYKWRVVTYSQGGYGPWTPFRNFLMLSVNTVPMMVDVSSDLLVRDGGWNMVTGDQSAIGADYLTSSGGTTDALTLTFEGTSVDVVYVAGPQYGTFVIEIDGVALYGINASAAQTIYGQIASVTDLASGTHTLRIVPLAGMPVAIDAIVVGGQAVITPETPVTPLPIEPAPVTPAPTEPGIESPVTPEPTPLPTEPAPTPEATPEAGAGD